MQLFQAGLSSLFTKPKTLHILCLGRLPAGQLECGTFRNELLQQNSPAYFKRLSPYGAQLVFCFSL